mmetsp:Transcript_50271/g.150134  ORF Transcript_50271/g.150134 Transcript_50271/m.150134 type:complete len:212 (-) Transcript_50271:76-711(-)
MGDSGARTTSTNSSSPMSWDGCMCLTCRPIGRRATSSVSSSCASDSTSTSPSVATSCSGTGKTATRATSSSSCSGPSSPQEPVRRSEALTSAVPSPSAVSALVRVCGGLDGGVPAKSEADRTRPACGLGKAAHVSSERVRVHAARGANRMTFTSESPSMPSSSRASKMHVPSRGKPPVSSSSATMRSVSSRSALNRPPRSPGSSGGTTTTR